MTRMSTSIRFVLAASVGAVALTGCASRPTGPVDPAYLEGDLLNRNPIGVRKQTEFLEIEIDAETSELSGADRRKIESFVQGYQASGQGALIMSLPASSANPQLAVAAIAEARGIAWENGVKYEEIAGATHGEGNAIAEPMVLAYQTYKAIAPVCKSFADIDIADVSSNNEMPNLGCAVRTNQALMIADAADLIGTRSLDTGDDVRRSVILEKFRKGESTSSTRTSTESGAVSQAVQN
jgi:pilus assembly protein CpaD